MTHPPYTQLIEIKRWADRGLCEAIGQNLDRLSDEEAVIMRRLLDRYTNADDHMWAETLLPDSADEELDRLVSVVMEVVGSEAERG